MCSRPARATPRCFRRSSPSGSALPRDKVTHRHGDSAMEIAGYASVGSRSAMTAGASIVKCIERHAGEGQARRRRWCSKRRRRHRVYETASSSVVGTDRRVSLFDARRPRRRSENARRHRRGSRHQSHHGNAADLSERRPYRRGRDRSRHRTHGHRRLHRGRRLRQSRSTP